MTELAPVSWGWMRPVQGNPKGQLLMFPKKKTHPNSPHCLGRDGTWAMVTDAVGEAHGCLIRNPYFGLLKLLGKGLGRFDLPTKEDGRSQ